MCIGRKQENVYKGQEKGDKWDVDDNRRKNEKKTKYSDSRKINRRVINMMQTREKKKGEKYHDENAIIIGIGNKCGAKERRKEKKMLKCRHY